MHMPSTRYHLRLATWIVVREAEEPLPRKIRNADDVAALAIEWSIRSPHAGGVGTGAPSLLQTYNTTAHQGLLRDQRMPPIPVEILGAAKGRIYAQEELARQFSQALMPRTTNRYGCVTLHSYHFYVEEGLPQTQVLLWVSGEQPRAAFDNVILAEYHCRYDWRDRQVKEIRQGMFYPTRFALSQGTLIPLTSQDSLGVAACKQRHPNPQTRGIFGSHSAPTRGGSGAHSPPMSPH
jgi:hypothetical protein